MLPYATLTAPRLADYRVHLADRPGWVWGTTRLPRQGEEVFCAAGMGTVKELLGRTGDGSRLVHIGFADTKAKPFFAAASNVLLSPASPLGGGDEAVSAPTDPEVWLGAASDTAHIR